MCVVLCFRICLSLEYFIIDHPSFLPVQSKLNCEVLSADRSFEVRWAIAGPKIVVQLLAKLGECCFDEFFFENDN